MVASVGFAGLVRTDGVHVRLQRVAVRERGGRQLVHGAVHRARRAVRADAVHPLLQRAHALQHNTRAQLISLSIEGTHSKHFFCVTLSVDLFVELV